MARLAIGAAGALAGFLIGGPAGAAIGFQLGSLAGGLIFHDKGGPSQGPRLSDLRQTNLSSYGNPVPFGYGVSRQTGTMIWMLGNKLKETPITVSGTTTYFYHATFAISLGEGYVQEILRIWANGKLIFDKRPDAVAGTVANNGPLRFKLYPGSEDQLPDPTMEADALAQYGLTDGTPAYRGQAYILFDEFPLKAYGNQIPTLEFEVARIATSAATVYNFSQVAVTAGGSDTLNNVSSNRLVVNPLAPRASTIDTSGILRTWDTSIQDGVTSSLLHASNSGAVFNGSHPRIDDLGNIYAISADRTAIMVYDGLSGAFVERIQPRTSPLDALNPEFILGPLQDVYPFTHPVLGRFAVITDGLAQVSIVALDVIPVDVQGTTMKMEKGQMSKVEAYMTPVSAIASDGGGCMTDDGNGNVWTQGRRTGTNPWSVIAGFSTDIGVYVDIIGRITLYPQILKKVFDVTAYAWFVGFVMYDHFDQTLIVQGAIPGGDFGSLDFRQTFKFSTVTYSVVLGPVVFQATINVHTDVVLAEDGTFVVPMTQQVVDETGILTTHDGLGVFDSNTLELIKWMDVTNLSLTQQDKWGGLASTATYVWDPIQQGLFINTSVLQGPQTGISQLAVVYPDRATGLGENLADVVTNLCLRAGLRPEDFDVVELQAYMVHGYLVASNMDVRSALVPLGQAYFFDACETGWDVYGAVQRNMMRFIDRSISQVAAVLTDSDLGVTDGGKNGEQPFPKLVENDEMELDLPGIIDVSFINNEKDYQPGHTQARRLAAPVPTVGSRSEETIQLPLCFNPTEAKAIGDRILYDLYIQRHNYEFSTGGKWAKLEPGDIVNLIAESILYRMRLMRVEIGANWQVQCTAIADDVSIHVTNEMASDAGLVAAATITPSFQPALKPLDIVAVSDAPVSSQNGLYAALGGYNDSFAGALLEASIDGRTWQTVTAGKTPAIGSSTTALPDVPAHSPRSPFIWDRTSTLRVRMATGALASATEADILNDGSLNQLVVGSEVLQFVNAVKQSDGTYLLDTFLRAQRGTEWATASHTAGEPVIPTAGLVYVNLPSTWRGSNVYLRASTFGTGIQRQAQLSVISANVALKPLSPVNAIGTRDGSNNLTVEWERRDRADQPWIDATQTIVNNDLPEKYEIDILDPVLGTVKRTVTNLGINQWQYSLADQNADFGTAQELVTIRIYQISPVVGRGYPLEVTL